MDLREHDAAFGDKAEKQADEMTRDGLIPKRVWQRNPIEGKATAAKVTALTEQFKIHPAIIAGRVRYEQNNYKLLSRYVGSKQVRKHFAENCSSTRA